MEKKEIVQDKIIKATKWSVGAEILAKLITPFTSMILARILVPEAFGIVATITIIISLVDLMTDAGFSKYIVQHRFDTKQEFEEYVNVAFWSNLSVSVVLWGLIVITSDFLAKLVGADGYEIAIVVAAFKLIITSFTSIQRAVYQRLLDYKTIFAVRMVVAFIPLIVTIPLALMGFNYWSLIIAALLNEIVYAVLLSIKSEWKPKLIFNCQVLKNMLSFSIWSLFEQLTIWITTYADSFIISHFLSAYYVGLYKQPYQLITNIYSVFTASVFAILFSALSRFNDDGDTLSYKTVLFNTQKFLSVLIVPMGVGIYMYREFITNILLGNKWNDAAIVIGCFALEKIIQILMNNPASEIYRSKGKPFVSVIAQLLFLIVLIPACVISLRQNFEIFVYVRAAMCLVFMVIHLVLVYMNFKINMLEVIPKMISVLVSAGVMLSIGYLLKKLLSEYFWFGFIKILICALIYSVCLLCFKDTRTIISECYYKFVMKRQTGDQL